MADRATLGGIAEQRLVESNVWEGAADVSQRGDTSTQRFVGRERELSELGAGLEEADAGRGSLFLLSGEAGIGKTRLAKEIAEHAARRGAQILWGHPWEGGGQPAYWPWVQILRAYARSEDPEVLAPEVGRYAAYLAQLVPELGALRPVSSEPLPPAHGDSDSARFYLFDSITELLRSASARRALVIVLDDVHAADLPSLRLLRFLAAELHQMRILAIATYRELEARRASDVGSLLADLESRRISIGGLTSSDIAALIEGSAGIAPASEVVSAVHRVTEGNPFFVDEIVRLLITENRLHSTEPLSGALRLPDGVREAIHLRLAPLPEKCQEILTVAAVAGREFDARLLQAVLDRPMEQVTRVLDEAIAEGIVVPASASFGRFRFAHALIRDTLYDEISSARRQRLHRNLGEILEGLGAGGSEEHVSALAHHFCEAAPAGVAGKGVEYAVRAGRRAMQLLAYEEAAGYFAMALRTSNQLARTRTDARCELLLELGAAQGAAGDRAKSRETFVEAAAVARAAGDAEKLAAAALGLARQSGFDEAIGPYGAPHEFLVRILEEALAAVPAEDSPLRTALLSGLASTTFWQPGSERRRQSLVHEAVEMAERLGDRGALISALTHKRTALLSPSDVEERLVDATRVLRLATDAGDRERELQAREARLYDLLELGGGAAVEVEIERIEELARALRQPRYLADAAMIRAMRTLMDGRFDEGEELAGRALTLNQQVRPEIAATLYGSQLLRTVWRERRRREDLEAGIKTFLDQEAPLPAMSATLAFVWSEQGKREDARAEFERVAADDFSGLNREAAWTSVMAHLSEVCCFLGDVPRAAVLYEQLAPFAALNILHGSIPHACIGPVAHFLGMLAATLGATDDASEHFESALAMEARLGMPAMRARTQYEYARMLLRSERPDDARRGAEMAASALQTSRLLGMEVLEDGIGALLAELPNPILDVSDAGGGEQPELEGSSMRREGEYWSIRYEGRTFRLKATKGLGYLAQLLRQPGREFFALELARRDRSDATSVESARASVTIAIRTALKRISENCPALGRHLASTVKTGKYCVYEPGPDPPSRDG